MRLIAPSNPKDRFEVYRFFNGLSSEAKEGLDQHHLRVPLVKTFLLEHVSCRDNNRPKTPIEIFQGLGTEIKKIDENFNEIRSEVVDPDSKKPTLETTGFLEQYDQRFFAYYTCEKSDDAKRRVEKWIQGPELDFAWFSSPLLYEIWKRDVSKRGDDRFCKLKFKHESIFEMPADSSSQLEPNEDFNEEIKDEVSGDEHFDIERRKASFEMGDRIGKIKKALSKLMDNYEPLHALHAIRIPSRIGHGGHELHQTGRLTNRTDSFEDHRNTMRYLYRIYKSILESTEKAAWKEISSDRKVQIGMNGAPLIVKFSEPLSEETFNRWIQMAFQKRNRFKLWGNPIRLGPTKFHIYGADRHLWQPINLELTSESVVAILPRGTCGNTFHRLVTNIQHYVCPKIKAWVGSESFDEVVGKWPENAEVTNEE